MPPIQPCAMAMVKKIAHKFIRACRNHGYGERKVIHATMPGEIRGVSMDYSRIKPIRDTISSRLSQADRMPAVRQGNVGMDTPDFGNNQQ